MLTDHCIVVDYQGLLDEEIGLSIFTMASQSSHHLADRLLRILLAG